MKRKTSARSEVVSKEASNEQSSTADEAPASGVPPSTASDNNVNGQLHLVVKDKVRLGSFFLCLCLANFAVGFDTKCVAIIIDTLVREFDSIGDIGWYSTAYLAAMCATTLTYGKLYNMLPLRPVFIISLCIFMAGSITCAAARASVVFIIGRAVAGLGGAGIVNGANIAISRISPLRYRPMLMGILGGVECMAIVVGPLIAGAITSYLTWRVCFYINVPISAAAIAVSIMLVRSSELDREPDDANKFASVSEFLAKIDMPGLCLIIIMTTCLLLGLQWGGAAYAWKSTPVLVTLVAAGVLLIVLGLQQRRKGSLATVQPAMLANRAVTLGALMCFCNATALYIVGYYLLLWYQAVLGFSAFKAGVYDLAYDLGFVVSLFAAGLFASWIGYYTPIMILGSILMSVGAGLLTTLQPSTKMVLIIIYQIIFSVGNGLAFQQPYVAVQTVLHMRMIPSALSVLTFAQSLGGTISLAAAQAVYLSSLNSHQETRGSRITHGAHLAPSTDARTVLLTNKALVAPFYIATVFSALTMISALGINWNSVKHKIQDQEKDGAVEQIQLHQQ